MGRIGLVVEGGGMKCAYSAGILDRFLDDHVTFDYAIGVSAGASSTASYLAGQRGRNLRFYTTHIHEKGYFGIGSFLKTGDLFGLDYIYRDLTNSDGADPLDFPALMKNPADYEVVASNANTGKPAYFDKSVMKQDDYIQIIASCCLPAACRPRIIDNVPYYDGGVSDPLPADRALTHGGCEKVVVIMTKPRDFEKKPEGMKAVYHHRCRMYPEIVKLLDNRHTTYMEHFRHIFDLEKEGKAFVLCPSEHLKMSTYAMDAEANQKLYDLGVSDYNEKAAALKAFLAGKADA